MKLYLRFVSFLFLLSCSSNIKSKQNTDSTFFKTNLNKPLNLVYIWTTWCGVSKKVLKDTYTALQKTAIDIK